MQLKLLALNILSMLSLFFLLMFWFHLVSFQNILSKSLGNNNSMNLAKATFEGLKSLQTVQDMADKRGLSVDQIYGRAE